MFAASTFSTSFVFRLFWLVEDLRFGLKNYAVEDLRLQTSRITWLWTCGCRHAFEHAIGTCVCGLRKLKFGCGVVDCGLKTCPALHNRGGVEDTRLEAKAKAKDTKKIRGQGQGQGQPFRGQTLSRPRTGMLEAKAKDQGHKAQVLSKKKKKKRSSQKFFRRSPKKKKKKKKKKGLHKIFQAISTKKRFPKNFSTAPQNFNFPKNSAVLEPRTGQFSRT